MPDKARLAVLISGRGSNLKALHQACTSGQIDATVALVISNNPDAAGLHYCQQHTIPSHVVDHRQFVDRQDCDRAIAKILDALDARLILLAGYLRLLSDEFALRYESKLLNIHPSLLPRYKGLNTHQRALDDGTRWHGCSVHFVTPQLDCGPIVARSAIRVRPRQSCEQLAAALLAREHRLYPYVVHECINGNIQLRAGKVMYKDKVLPYPLLV